MSPRTGSFLFICIALTALMIILCVAVLHEVRLQIDTSVGNQRYILAEGAARTGLDHAIEQILADYQSTTMNYAHTGMNNGMSLPAVTCLDGPWRSTFNSLPLIYAPSSGIYVNSLDGNIDNGCPNSEDSVSPQHTLLMPWVWQQGEIGQWYGWMPPMEYDGRGRYYEPEFYNVTRLPLSTQQPVSPANFTVSTLAIPERNGGVFYDDQLRRIPPSGNPLQDRQNARYRLRYVVGVEDLSAHLLINPIPDMHLLTSETTGSVVDYRTPGVNYPWMPLAINAIGTIAGRVGGGTYACQVEHVFQGRGYRTNVDLDHTSAGIRGFPKTFPLMYRDHPDPGGSGCWGLYDDGPSQGGDPTNLFWQSCNGSITVKGLATGGEFIWPGIQNENTSLFSPYCGNDQMTIAHCLMGPQMSFSNTAYAIDGEKYQLDHNPWDRWEFTPFGRGLTSAGYTPYGQNNKWYQGRVDTPFYLNLLTVTPAVTDAMIAAYIPPRETNWALGSVYYYVDQHSKDGWGNEQYVCVGSAAIDPTQANNHGSIFGRDLLVDTTSTAFSLWPAQDRKDGNTGAATNPPGASNIGQVIKPDYYAPDQRDIVNNTYPGAAMNGQDGKVLLTTSATGPFVVQGTDNLGANLTDILTRCSTGWGWGGYGLDTYTLYPFMKLVSTSNMAYASQFGATPYPTDPTSAAAIDQAVEAWAGNSTPPPAAFGQNATDYAYKYPVADGILHNQSYYFDLAAALAMAITVFRDQHMLLPTNNHCWGNSDLCQFNQSTYFMPEQYQTIRDLDRAFLAELGESLDAPGTGSTTTLWMNGAIFPWSLNGGGPPIYMGSSPYESGQFAGVPKHNIWDLVQQDLLANADRSLSSIQRAHVMELMLNDFRMSFFGCNPTYSDCSDPTKEFRPLDFVGDGRAYCSCYQGMNPAPPDPHDPTADLPWAPPGTKPPIYWTVSGTFFIGKSHYYRIFCRGEVWDNLKNLPTDTATVDAALAVDPEGTDPSQTQLLYQRWAQDRYIAQIPRVQR